MGNSQLLAFPGSKVQYLRSDEVVVDQSRFTSEWNELLSEALSTETELVYPYYKLRTPVLLKSRAWLKKLIKNIMDAATVAVPTQVIAISGDDQRHLERIAGTTDQREFVSLHAFLVRYATDKYNFPKLV